MQRIDEFYDFWVALTEIEIRVKSDNSLSISYKYMSGVLLNMAANLNGELWKMITLKRNDLLDSWDNENVFA